MNTGTIKEGDWVIYKWDGKECRGKIYRIYNSRAITLESYDSNIHTPSHRQITYDDIMYNESSKALVNGICMVCGGKNKGDELNRPCVCNIKPEFNKEDMVNSPKHYTFGKIEVITVIEDWQLGFHEGNCIKYIARAKHKGNELEDLKKAQFYLNRCVKNLELNMEAGNDK